MMAGLALAYLEHAKAYYSQSGEAYQYSLALRPVVDLYASLPAVSLAKRNFWQSDSNV
jgi:hypothetical protein